MNQCFSCLSLNMHGQAKGKGKCRETELIMDALKGGLSCKVYVLAPMDMVRARSQRSVTFDLNDKVILK